MKISFSHRGSFSKTEKFLSRSSRKDYRYILERYGARGVIALENATPVDTSLTKNSWSYKITKERYGYSLSWHNTNMAGGIPVVILIQYGHGTRGGTYVQGIDFINPAIKPILDGIANDIWKEVTAL